MIRVARPDDWEAVSNVLIESRRAFLPFAPSVHPDDDVRQWVKEYLLQSHSVVVWEMGGDVVAVIAFTEELGKSWINQLYVLPGFTGQGIGTALLRHAGAALRGPIWLYKFQENDGARKFYERQGFEAVSFTEGQDNENRCPDVFYMRAQSTDA